MKNKNGIGKPKAPARIKCPRPKDFGEAIPPDSKYFYMEGAFCYARYPLLQGGHTVVNLSSDLRLTKGARFAIAALAMVEWNESFADQVQIGDAVKLQGIVDFWRDWRDKQ